MAQKRRFVKLDFNDLNGALLSVNAPRPYEFPDSTARPASSNFRWVICGLLFFSTTVNYMDRQVISYLKEFFCTPAEQGGFGWTNTDFAQSDLGLHRLLRRHDHPRRLGH